MKHIHILGISGTFMSGLALLAKELGYKVTGSDAHCYPPVSDLLATNGIDWVEGYDDATLALKADEVLIGNAIKRGMPVLEALLNQRKPYLSGPQWLAEHVLNAYQVIAVAGTHGKTTTTCMTSWILDQAGLHPGFLIGGVATNFNSSCRLGRGDWFVIEADEYDSAFFDKRPKFMHYKPQVAVLNNLEFDHADIYPNLEAIQLQFHYLMRTIPQHGMVIVPRDDIALQQVVQRGVFSRIEQMACHGQADWVAELVNESGSAFNVYRCGERVAHIEWGLVGQFNVENALSSIIASYHAGVDPSLAAKALERFTPVKRRLEIKSDKDGITVYDDFAHHPTAIRKTVEALKNSRRHKRILAVLEFGSYTMRKGVHAAEMAHALAEVDEVFVLEPQDFSIDAFLSNWTCSNIVCKSHKELVSEVVKKAKQGDAILIMSNKGFNGIHKDIILSLPDNQHYTSPSLFT